MAEKILVSWIDVLSNEYLYEVPGNLYTQKWEIWLYIERSNSKKHQSSMLKQMLTQALYYPAKLALSLFEKQNQYYCMVVPYEAYQIVTDTYWYK